MLSFIAVASLCLESTAKSEQLELTRIWKHRVCEQKKGNWANVVINDYLHYQLICPLSYLSTKCQNILKYVPQNLPEPKVTSSNSFYCPTTSEKPEKQQKSWRFSECLACLLKEKSKTTNLVSQKLAINFFSLGNQWINLSLPRYTQEDLLILFIRLVLKKTFKLRVRRNKQFEGVTLGFRKHVIGSFLPSPHTVYLYLAFICSCWLLSEPGPLFKYHLLPKNWQWLREGPVWLQGSV